VSYDVRLMQKEPHSPTRSTPRSLKLHRSVVGPETAPPVLVLHGITGSRRYWLPRILPLASRWRLLIPDLPGFGLSPKPFTDYTPAFFVETLIGLLEQQRVRDRKIQIIGHSLGGVLGLELAARYPKLVEGLTLLNIPRLNDPQEAHDIWFEGSASYRNLLMANSVAQNWAQVRRTGLRLTAKYMKRLPWAVVADCRRFTFRSLTSTLEHCLLHYRVDAVLPAVPRIPVVMIHGDADQVAPVDRALEFPSLPPYPALHVIRGAGHHPFHTHTDICLEVIQAQLRGDSPGAAASGPVIFVSPGSQPPRLDPPSARPTARRRLRLRRSKVSISSRIAPRPRHGRS
jgi:pimeloyl-ACP methyl ester carboxylesterase